MKIEIADYRTTWPEDFKAEADRLRGMIDLPGLRLEHIGSTAVPGLAAKPIIDILMGVSLPQQLDLLPAKILKEKAYYYVPAFESAMPYRRFFIKTNGRPESGDIPQIIQDDAWKLIEHGKRCIHLHCTAVEHVFFEDHLRFRDLLRSQGPWRRAYEKLKRELAERSWESGAEYADVKASFIREALQTNSPM
jgi:GrpB-like predicted nucleotidyltransferase (UPF0157 family)